MKLQYRQGDGLLFAVDRILPGAKPVPRGSDRAVMAEGELTVHVAAPAPASRRAPRRRDMPQL